MQVSHLKSIEVIISAEAKQTMQCVFVAMPNLSRSTLYKLKSQQKGFIEGVAKTVKYVSYDSLYIMPLVKKNLQRNFNNPAYCDCTTNA